MSTCTPSASCYQRCGKADCRERRMRYLKERRIYGPKRIPAGPSRDLILMYRQTYSLGYLGHVLGLNTGHIAHIAAGKSPTISRDIADRIAAFRPVTDTVFYVDATGTRRRLQALVLRGRPIRELAALLGYSPHWVSAVSQRRIYRVAQERATAVRALFDELHDAPIKTGRSALLAIRGAENSGFVPAAAWDDLDNPAEQPRGTVTELHLKADDVDEAVIQRRLSGDLSVKVNQAERLKIVAHLHADGYTDGRIQLRTGIDARQVLRDRRRLGLPPNASNGREDAA